MASRRWHCLRFTLVWMAVSLTRACYPEPMLVTCAQTKFLACSRHRRNQGKLGGVLIMMITPGGRIIEYVQQLRHNAGYRPFAGMSGSHLNDYLIAYNLTGYTKGQLSDADESEALVHAKRELNRRRCQARAALEAWRMGASPRSEVLGMRPIDESDWHFPDDEQFYAGLRCDLDLRCAASVRSLPCTCLLIFCMSLFSSDILSLYVVGYIRASMSQPHHWPTVTHVTGVLHS